jgi:hypothetical protein
MRVLTPNPQYLVSASDLERCHERPDGAVTNRGIAPFRVTDYGDGKRRAGIAWPFDAAGNYLNSRSRVNLRDGATVMHVFTHTFDCIALGVLIACMAAAAVIFYRRKP